MAKAWVKIANLKGPKGDVGTWFIRNLSASDSLDTLTEFGTYGVLSGATAEAIGMPFPTAGNVTVYPVGISVVQDAKALAPRSENWQRELYANGTVWGEWRRTDFRKEQPDGLRTASPAGMKTAPQAVTLGHGGAQVTGSGFARGLIHLASSVTRLRVHIANRNPRYGFADDPAVALAAVTIGTHTGAGAQSLVTTIASGASTGANGYTSPWVDTAAYAGKDVLIGYDYSSAGTIQSNIGTGYGAAGVTGAAGTATAAKLQAMPLFVWVEVEVPSSTAVIAAFGDSLSAGVGSSNVVFDSPVSQYARTIDGVPVHFAASGDTMLTWETTAKKWAMYGNLTALADAVIFGMGSNDVFGGYELAELQARNTAVMASIRYRISPNVYGATIMPRTGVTGTAETTRRDYNTWLKARPEFRKVFDFAASISADDETITPAYDSDGTHLTTLGYAQNAARLTGVVSAPVTAKALSAVDVRVDAVDTRVDKTKVVPSESDEWPYAVTDSAGRVLYGVRNDGSVAALRFQNLTRSNPTRWACVGDSLTDGYSNGAQWAEADSWPSKLQALLPAGTAVTNYGQSGATSDQINTLMGAQTLAFRVPSGTIPASGAVALETGQIIGGWEDVTDLSFTGWLYNIPGTLTRTAGAWSFTRTAAGKAKPVGRRAYFQATYRDIAWDSAIIMYGRNDITKAVQGMEASIPDHTIRAYTDYVEFMIPRFKQFIVCGTTTRTDEPENSAGWLKVTEINTRLRALYPSNYIDVQGYLVNKCIYDLGITPTQADLDAIAAKTIPPSLMDDVTHWSRAVANALAVNLFAPFIIKKGWV